MLGKVRKRSQKAGVPDRPARHFLREWRESKGLTQEQLGERIGVTGSNVSLLENGKQNYTQRILEDIAKALEVEAASLLAEDPTNQDGIWELIGKLRRLPVPVRRQALAVLDTLIQTHE